MSKQKTVTVCGLKVKIVIKDLSKQGVLGLCYADKRQIYLHDKLTAEERHRVLMHEIIHFIIDVNLGHDFMSDEKEEILCNVLEAHLSTFYRSIFR